MKLVTGLLAPFQLELARTALVAAGAQGMTVTEAGTSGAGPGAREVYRGAEVAPGLLPRLRVEVVVEEPDVTAAVKALCVAARSGDHPVGTVWSARSRRSSGCARARAGPPPSDRHPQDGPVSPRPEAHRRTTTRGRTHQDKGPPPRLLDHPRDLVVSKKPQRGQTGDAGRRRMGQHEDLTTTHPRRPERIKGG